MSLFIPSPGVVACKRALSRWKPAFSSLGLVAQCPEETSALLTVSLTDLSVADYSFYKAAPCSPESLPSVCGSQCCFTKRTTCYHAATDGNSSWGLSYETWAGEARAVTSTQGFHAWGLSFSSCSTESCPMDFSPSPPADSVTSGKLLPLPMSQMG